MHRPQHIHLFYQLHSPKWPNVQVVSPKRLTRVAQTSVAQVVCRRNVRTLCGAVMLYKFISKTYHYLLLLIIETQAPT